MSRTKTNGKTVEPAGDNDPKSGRPRQSCDIHRVARQCGVKLFDGSRRYHSTRDPRECFSPATLRRIGRAHGAAHLALVLRLIVETDDNAAELYGETLLAVSELLDHRPDLVEHGLLLFEMFDRIDLGGLRRRARTLACGMPVSHVMRILLALEVDRLSEQMAVSGQLCSTPHPKSPELSARAPEE